MHSFGMLTGVKIQQLLSDAEKRFVSVVCRNRGGWRHP